MKNLSRIISLIVLMSVYFYSDPLLHASTQNPGVSTLIKKGEQEIKDNRFDEASETYRRLLELYESGKDHPDIAKGLKWGGNLAVMQGRPVDALRFYANAVKSAQKYGNKSQEATTLCNIGLVYGIFRDYDSASEYFERAIAVNPDDKYITALAYANLTTALCGLNNVEKAEQYLRLQLAHPIPDSIENSFHILYNRGAIARLKANPEHALQLLDSAVMIIRGHKESLELTASALIEQARALKTLNLLDSAENKLSFALKLQDDAPTPQYLHDTYLELTDLYKREKNPDSVYKYQALYFQLMDSLYNRAEFNHVKGNLNRYEKSVTNRRISLLKQQLIWATVCVFILAVAVFGITYYLRKLRKAQKMLVEKNEELFSRNKELFKLAELANGSTADEELSVSCDPDGRNIPQSAYRMEILNRINEVIADTETIANPDFSLPQLAQLVNSNTSYVSAIINETFGRNFKSFINELRIQEACRRLADPENDKLTLLAIATETGFGSQNSFINNFKKVTGMTPSAYKALIRKTQ